MQITFQLDSNIRLIHQHLRLQRKIQQYIKQMSTNGNEADELMEESLSKQTKVEKFLKIIDQQIMAQIEKYLQQNEPPTINEGASKVDKIKLWHDLSIIQRFKQYEKQISKKGNKKIIEELCQILKDELSLSAVSIRQRIQKKLPNVSKQAILNHIKLGIDFTFDTKRKLMPITASKATKQTSSKEELYFEDNSANNSTFRQEKNIHVIHSSGSQSSHSVQQIITSYRAPPKTFTRKAIRQSEQKSREYEVIQNINKNRGAVTNTFHQLSEHESDDEYLAVKLKESFKFKLTSKNVEEMNQLVLGRIKQFYEKRKKDGQNNALANSRGQNQVEEDANNANDIQEDAVYNAQINQIQKQQEKDSKKIANKELNKKQNQNNNQVPSQNILPQSNLPEQIALPNEEYLKCYNSVQQWKLANSNQELYGHLKWYPEEDQYLKNIVKSFGSEATNQQLQVLKKFKTVPNIIARIRFLKLHGLSHLEAKLANQS